MFTHLFLKMTSEDKYHYACFADEGTEPDLPEDMWLVRAELGSHPQCCHVTCFVSGVGSDHYILMFSEPQIEHQSHFIHIQVVFILRANLISVQGNLRTPGKFRNYTKLGKAAK